MCFLFLLLSVVPLQAQSSSNNFGFFGIQNTQTTTVDTKQTPSKIYAGGSDTGMKAPCPPVSEKFRGDGIKGDDYSGQSGILQYWLEGKGTLQVRQTISFGPWVRLGKITKPMVWGVNGYIQGGYTKTTNQRTLYKGSYQQFIEKWNDEL